MPAPCRHRYLYRPPRGTFSVPRTGQRTVTLSAAQYAAIETLVDAHPALYESVSQFVKHAIAEQIIKTQPGRP